MEDNQLFTLLPSLPERRGAVEAEFDAYYRTCDQFAGPLVAMLEEMWQAHDGEGLSKTESALQLKTKLIGILCDHCPVHLFRETDFFFEMDSGRPRFSWGGLYSPAGTFLRGKTHAHWLTPFGEAVKPDLAEGYLHCWSNPVGFDHHCAGYDRVLTIGLSGIVAEAEAMLAQCTDSDKAAFYRAVIETNKALAKLAGRFAAEGRRLAEECLKNDDSAGAAHYTKIAEAAAWVPWNPPRTFYEGLCATMFYRECVGSVEGIGISILGHFDRSLYPLYRDDLAAGRTTKAEALRLLCDFLLYTDTRFQLHESFHETSTTIELGGCDREGNVVYNELTELVLSAVYNVRSVNTKINCRLSAKHPRAYLERLAALQLSDLPTFMMKNDDVLIPARVRQGQAVEDARLYVGGGCHEIVLMGTEVCTRADTWISMPKLVLDAMETGIADENYERFYQRFLDTVHDYHKRVAETKNTYERLWSHYDPLPLYSSSLEDTLPNGRDATAGGTRYNSTALSMVGTATMIDSLYTIKKLVFEDGTLSMADFLHIIKENFTDNEVLRQQILTKIPKYGTHDATLDAFAGEVMTDVSAAASGLTNGRGGKYLPAFYPHNVFLTLGERLGATPDGRHARTPLSRGASPSEFIETDSPLDLVRSLEAVDFTAYADSFCAELTLPRMENTAENRKILTAITEAFLEAGGSSLQLNLLDRDMLRDAQQNPDRYRHLSVRVCGYSAVFIYLGRNIQEEVIARAIR